MILSPIQTYPKKEKHKYKTTFSKINAPIIHKNSCIFSKCDNVIGNIQILMSLQVVFWCENLHKYEKNMERVYSIVISIFKKKNQ